jgi:hypothetical protein
MSTIECKHELPIDQCDWCKPKPPTVSSPFTDPDDGVGPVFVAAFETRCPGCGTNVEPGDDARMIDGEAWHEECDD